MHPLATKLTLIVLALCLGITLFIFLVEIYIGTRLHENDFMHFYSQQLVLLNIESEYSHSPEDFHEKLVCRIVAMHQALDESFGHYQSYGHYDQVEADIGKLSFASDYDCNR